MRLRIRELEGTSDRVVYVASTPEKGVVGWIDVGITRHLQAEPRAEIGGLVVSSGARNCGIGRELVLRAEDWARERGMDTMIVRSRTTREAAHRFYRREGYSEIKTSAVFSKHLARH